MSTELVLLVLIGALGDLAWRKFLEAARALEGESRNLSVLYVDLPWRDAGEKVPLADELRWRIARRLIELRAEEIDSGKVAGVGLKSNLSDTSLPWVVEEFVREHLEGDEEALGNELTRLGEQVENWLAHLMETSPLSGMTRYATDAASIRREVERLRGEKWKVVVFAATPPQAYPSIVDCWHNLADRIVLEKPAGGLDSRTLSYSGTNQLRQVVTRVSAPAQAATNDHYNAKLTTRIMDCLADFHILDGPLDPSRVRRIVVELLEAAPLPMGRYGFYNGAGGAFGDMVPHLIQAVRAAMRIPQSEMKIELDKFHWGRYEGIPGEFARRESEPPYAYEPDYYQPLLPQTETFVAFKAFVTVAGHRIPLYCRTGKGFRHERKTLRIVSQYRDDAPEMNVIFNLGENTIQFSGGLEGLRLVMGKIMLADPFRSGVPVVDTEARVAEYKGIFKTLVGSEWSAGALDERYFPSTAQAADVADSIFKRLMEERAKPRVLHAYSTDKPETYARILSFFDEEAHWDGV